MEALVYDNAYLQRHPLFSKCGSLLNDVSNRDYSGTDYFDKEIRCLDMDTYESKICKSAQPKSTMDAVIGLASQTDGQLRDRRLLMIELRMKYKNTNNLSLSELREKMSHTRDLLSEDSLRIDSSAWFVFNKNVTARAERWFAQQSRVEKALAKCKVCDVSQFRECIQKPLCS